MMKYTFTILISILFLSITFQSNAQGKLSLYKVNSDNTEDIFNDKDTINFGNPGVTSPILSQQIIVRNESSTESLKINTITFDDTGIFGYFPASGEMTINPNEAGSFYIYYSAASNIDLHKGFLTFSSSDPQASSVTINTIVNKDDGELKVSSPEYPIVNHQIDLGDVLIGEIKRFTIEMENIGEGYMFVDKTEFDSETNKLISTYHTKQGFGKGTTYNNNLSFKAMKKGAFEATIKNKLERGQVDEHQIKVIGNVLSPDVEISYEGDLLQPENTITENPLPYATQQFRFTVENKGNADLTINGVTLNQNDDREYHMPNSGIFTTIKPNASFTYTLELIPSSIGEKNVEVIFNTTDVEAQTIKVDFSTIIEAAVIRFEDKNGQEITQNLGFDMQSTSDNAVVTDELYIKNIGNKVLSITQFNEIYDIYNQFSFDYSGSDIGVNERQKISFTYFPNGYNAYKKSFPIDIVSNAHENKTIRFNVHAFHQYHEAELRYDGNLVSESYPIDFGRFDINTGKEITLLVQNSGTLPLTIKNVSFKNTGQNDFEIKEFTQNEIKANENGKIVIQCNSSKAHQHLDEILKVETSDYKNAIQTVRLTANPVKSEFYMSNPENTITVWNGDVEEYGPLSYERDFEYTYVIQNRGAAPLTIKAITVDPNDGYTLNFSGFDLPITLQPSEKQNLIMSATPHLPGEYNSKVHITTDEPSANHFSYTVKMTSLLPVLEVTHNNEVIQPSIVDFAGFDAYTLTVLNRGTDILELPSILVSDNDEFSISYDEKVDFLRPQESLDITINYSPKDKTKVEGTFSLKTNDKKMEEFSLILKERTITSIDDQVVKIDVYPNPTENQLYIKGISQQVKVRIFDLYGVQHVDQMSNGVIDVSRLHTGIYLLDINGQVTRKVIIK
ncbi:choice-of-anchor D domain-containing protein [Flammeovirga sp. EKP202]|nr:choice-of-anchor D domain-containing protein [Flammeovirga sp. EKP202]